MSLYTVINVVLSSSAAGGLMTTDPAALATIFICVSYKAPGMLSVQPF